MYSTDTTQLSDLAFQRHILVQGLILIDFLLSLTESAKRKWADIERSNPKSANKTLLYSYTLNDENVSETGRVEDGIPNTNISSRRNG